MTKTTIFLVKPVWKPLASEREKTDRAELKYMQTKLTISTRVEAQVDDSMVLSEKLTFVPISPIIVCNRR